MRRVLRIVWGNALCIVMRQGRKRRRKTRVLSMMILKVIRMRISHHHHQGEEDITAVGPRTELSMAEI